MRLTDALQEFEDLQPVLLAITSSRPATRAAGIGYLLGLTPEHAMERIYAQALVDGLLPAPDLRTACGTAMCSVGAVARHHGANVQAVVNELRRLLSECTLKPLPPQATARVH